MGKIHDWIADFHAFIGNLMAKNQKEYTREYTLEEYARKYNTRCNFYLLKRISI